MKTTRIILVLLIGVVLGMASTLGYLQWQRVRFQQTLPWLVERTESPLIDETCSVWLSKREGVLHRSVRDWLGGPRENIETMVRLAKSFDGEPPIFSIGFDAGVTSEEVEATISELAEHGVKRFFLGTTFYGKPVQPWAPVPKSVPSVDGNPVGR